MRALTIVNLVLWMVLFAAWIPYTAVVGISDPASVEVRTILAVTAFLMGLLAAVRIRRRRPVLG
jgi:MYXO-CTERM domain-containing protein